MTRTRSIRPRKAPTIQDLDGLVRQLGRPPRDLLQSISETLVEGDAQPLSTDMIPDFVAEAITVCQAAHLGYQRCSPLQRAYIRGFSLDLLTLAADLVLRLERAFREYQQCETEMVAAAAQLTVAAERGFLLCEQARCVIQKVAGKDACPTESSQERGEIITTLTTLAQTARSLLREGTSVTRSRCVVFSLDDSYVQALNAAVAELGELERKASDVQTVSKKKAEAEQGLVVARPLINQISRAFEFAHRFDPSIAPLLAPQASSEPSGHRSGPDKSSQILPVAKAHGHEGPNASVGGSSPHRKLERVSLGQPSSLRSKR